MSKIMFKNAGKSVDDVRQEKASIDESKKTDAAPIGIQFPLRRGSKSYETLFKMNDNVFDQISNNLKVFIMTQKGELIGKPDFGTILHNIYNRTDLEKEDIENLAMQDLSAGISKYFPFVNLIDYESFEVKENSNVNADYVKLDIRYNIQGFEESVNRIQIKIRRSN